PEAEASLKLASSKQVQTRALPHGLRGADLPTRTAPARSGPAESRPAQPGLAAVREVPLRADSEHGRAGLRHTRPIGAVRGAGIPADQRRRLSRAEAARLLRARTARRRRSRSRHRP